MHYYYLILMDGLPQKKLFIYNYYPIFISFLQISLKNLNLFAYTNLFKKNKYIYLYDRIKFELLKLS